MGGDCNSVATATNQLFAVLASLVQEVGANQRSTPVSRKLLHHLGRQLEGFENSCDLAEVWLTKKKLEVKQKLTVLEGVPEDGKAAGKTETLVEFLQGFDDAQSLEGAVSEGDVQAGGVKRQAEDELEVEAQGRSKRARS
eukprot:TRINITY_DN46065_c0_g1_i1.p1 TRINITY_DN46065_c0_g1~~TRINITY_DN46065_c0_g1_i1.p1  ORF type:complete len:140 (+),score=28.38 TRINITY_DN46065_c0_g1_i1:188-607(+)